MFNCIAVCSHLRPECLYLCLESLRKCRRIENYFIYIASNEDSSFDIPYVVKDVLTGLNYEIGIRPAGWLAERSNGEALKTGINKSDKLCILLAEDEVVSKDFLEVVESIDAGNNNDKILSISLAGIRLDRDYTEEDVEWLVQSGWFSSRGCTIFKKPFKKYVEQYLCEQYYQCEYITPEGIRMTNTAFLQTLFPGIFIHWGVDGLIQRVIHKYNLLTLSSVIPRSNEIGFYGAHIKTDSNKYHKVFENKGLMERVETMKSLIATGEISRLFGKWDYQYSKIQEDHKWKELKVVEGNFDIFTQKMVIMG